MAKIDDAAKERDGENFSAGQLKNFVKRIEKLEEDKAAVSADISEVYSEAKNMGFDAKIIRQVLRLKKMEEQQRREQQELLELYMSVLGIET
jgi:uncharacterized protein (UPF0335 family)